MTILISILVLLYGAFALCRPRQCRMWERTLLRCVRLISRKRLRRPITNGQLYVERAVGILLILLGVSDLFYVDIVLKSNATAAAAPSGVVSNTDFRLKAIVHEAANDFITEHKPVGLAIGILDGNTSFSLGFGEPMAGNGIVPDERTLFEIGSITKTFTATVLADLVLRNELTLDQPLQQLLPAAQRVPSFKGFPITLLHLATHTSGLPRLPPRILFQLFIPGFARNPYGAFSAEHLYDFLQKYEITAPPGKSWEYSNLGAGLLGFALARHTSSTCDTMYRRHICDPLGMRDTAIGLSPEQTKRLAKGYCGQLNAGPVGLHQEAENWDFQDTLAGGGALKSSIHNMLLYLQANVSATSSPLNAAIKYGQQVHFADGNTTMGLGWVHLPVKDIGVVICHDGGTGGYTSIIIFQRNGIGVVILCNTAGAAVTELGVKLLRVLSQIRPSEKGK